MNSLDVSSIPEKTGIYLFKDGKGKILYVGKAKNLKARLRQYLRPEQDSRPRVVYLMRKTKDLEFFLTSSEREALLLENNLIKKHRPPYNVYFRDDKDYLCLRVDLSEQFPRFRLVRKVADDGAVYLGPYSSAKKIRFLLGIAIRLFPMRTCPDSCLKSRSAPCMQYQIKRCPAPCAGLITEEAYRENIQKALKFFRGDYKAVQRELKQKMKSFSKELKFEKAAEIRDTVRVIEELSASQSVVNAALPDSDIFGIYQEKEKASVAIIFLRNCRVIDVRCYGLDTGGVSEGELIGSILSQYYEEGVYLPDEILVPGQPEDPLLRRQLANGLFGGVTVKVPSRGKRRELSRLAAKNAKEYFEARKIREVQYDELMRRMVKGLRLTQRPERIECYDVSHHGGASAVGGMVVFEYGVPSRNRYRRFRIRSVEGIDDYMMIAEIVARRVKRGREFGPIPDLIVIDGGKGHISACLKEIGGLSDRVDVVSIAKGRGINDRGGDDRIYVPGRKNPLKLRSDDPVLLFLKRMRDEAHRFAISYHRLRDDKEKLRSLMYRFPGIGRVRVKRLMSEYHSVRDILEKPPREIASLLKISAARAEDFIGFLRREYPGNRE